MSMDLSKAKKQLSKLVDMAYRGQKVTIAKNNLPVIDLVRHRPVGQRKLGAFRGKIEMSEDFVSEDSEVNRLFYGPDE